MLAWLLVEKIRDGHSTTLGAASGIVAGLVAITPACSSVTPVGAILVGAISSILSAYAIGLKYKFGYDDSLDVVGVHLVSGLAGSLLVGVFASSAAPAGVNGLLYGGGADQLIKQAIACVAVIGYCFIVTFLLGKILDKTIGIRVKREEEIAGVDLVYHAESAYELGGAFKGGR
jgi:Amt family ammonium transporter